jgi:hypothetical protein
MCGEKLEEFGGVFMLGLDRPYVNLWFHRACFDSVEDNLLEYLNTKIAEISKEIPNYS